MTRVVPLVVAAFAVALAIAAGAVALDARNDASDARDELAAVQEDLRELRTQAGRVDDVAGEGEAVRADVARILECIPELVTNVGGVESYLRNPDFGLSLSNYSRDCQAVLYGSVPGD